MRIDWTQTLLGLQGVAGAEHPAQPEAARALLLTGRMAGLIAAVLILAAGVAIAPFSSVPGLRVHEVLAVAGLLVVQVTAFAIQRQARILAQMAVAMLSALQLVLVAGLGAGSAVILSVAVLILAEIGATLLLLRSRRGAAVALLLAGLLAAAGGLFVAATQPVAVALIAAIAVPSLAMLPMLIWRRRKPLARAEPAAAPLALPDLVPSGFPGPVLVVDSVGQVQPPPALATPHGPSRSHPIAPPSLTDLLLVVDRPALLQALSRAMHEQQPSENLALRLRQGPGTPDEGQYRIRKVSVWPLAGMPGRALVLLSEPAASLPQARREGGAGDAALVHRAMHDAVSPFNAGLGYLELIADPRLAPRDLASTRHYAQEAREALIEAHRNTALMGRWLKLLAVPQPAQRERIELSKVALDAARIFTSADSDAPSIIVEAAPQAVHADLGGDIARFAIAVLLRGAMREGRAVSLAIRSAGPDAVLAARILAPKGGAGAPELFQMALEQAVQGFAPAHFASDGEERILVLQGVAVKPLQVLKSDEIEPLSRGRLAS